MLLMQWLSMPIARPAVIVKLKCLLCGTGYVLLIVTKLVLKSFLATVDHGTPKGEDTKLNVQTV